PPPAVVDWIRANAVPIRTAEAGHGFDDLEPLRETIGDARVVALGEATHGTREFFQLKHRMLEFLVARMGFDGFAIEANMPEAFDVNDYVLTGRGDPEKALAGLYFWTWDTQEVLDLIRWMRRWNNDPAHRTKVKFYGIDMQYPTRAAGNALEFLRRLDPAAADSADRTLRPLADPYRTRRGFGAQGSGLPTAAAADSALRWLAARLERPAGRDRMHASDREFVRARQDVRVVQQWLDLTSASGPAARDRAMAENVQWILDTGEPGSKLVVWAHNGHVSMAEPGAGAAGMGHALHAALGPDLVVFGFAFDRGDFQAVDAAPGGARGLAPFHVGPARSGSLDDAMSRGGNPIAALDLRRLPGSGEAADWFSRPQWTRSIGAVYADTFAERYYARLVPTESFDALLFVDSTSAARANARGARVSTGPKAAPGNLDFERGALGQPPPDWTGPMRLAADNYRAETRRDDARSGSLCGTLRRIGSRSYGETYGALEQVLDAAPYRGKRVRLSALVRVEPGSPRDEAFLQLRASSPPGKPGFSAGMEETPIRARGWRRYVVEGDIPPEAGTIAFGLAFVGKGAAWIDDVTLESGALENP
ncbi:MAG TPA: erythromycin esterase family protein, partial [Candidatus Eisenbacteria bacterium]|nr:erythromycin esterase family protein [Candidatus Eisenbacteria bacterium]